MSYSHRPTERDVSEAAKIATASTNVTVAQLLQWCDQKLEGEQDYNTTINISIAKGIIRQAVMEICK